MTILKSIIFTVLFFVIATLLDLLIVSFDSNLATYPHVVGLSYVLPGLLTYLLLIVYFRRSNTDVALKQGSVVKNYWLLTVLLISLAVGDHLFDLPFFQWKDLSNKYLGTEFKVADTSGYKFSFFKLYYYFSILIIAPIFEEIFFRYYIFGGLLKKYNFLTALLTSTILFASIHIENLHNIIPAFAFGIISAIVYFRTQRIIYSMLLHFLTNAIWLGTVVFAKQYDDLIKALGLGISFWLAFLFGIFLLVVGLKKITTANMRLAASLPTTGLADK
jgi:membrane protease YdiL (CAAX protease family)